MPLERVLRVDHFEEMTLELVHKRERSKVRQRPQEECSRQKEQDVQRGCSITEPGVSEKQTQCGWRIVKGREIIKRFYWKSRQGPSGYSRNLGFILRIMESH